MARKRKHEQEDMWASWPDKANSHKDLIADYGEKWIEDYQQQSSGTLYDWNQATIQEFKGVDVETLLTDPYFLNLKDTVFPGVWEDIIDLWEERKKREVNLALFLEGIGSGKSMKASIIAWLLSYELCMHENPQKHYGLADNSIIAIMLLSRTETQTRRVIFTYVWDRFQSQFNRDYFPVNPKFSRELRIERNRTCIYAGTSSALSALGYNAYCLTGDSKIQLADGSNISLEQLEGCGKLDIKGFDLEAQQFVNAQVEGVVCSGEKEVFELELEDGSLIKATGDHPILTYKKVKSKQKRRGVTGSYLFKYKKLRDLTDKDEIVTQKDFVSCAVTGALLTQITSSHLKAIGYTFSQYKDEFPNAELVSPLVKMRISKIRKERYPHGSRGFGWHHSDQVKKKISQGNKGKECTDKTRKAVSKALKGKELSKEHREKISEYIRKNGNPFEGKKHTQETIEKIKATKKKRGYYISEETRHKLSLKSRGKNNPRYGKPPAHGKRVSYKGVKFRSSWEAKVAKFLDDNKIGWEYESYIFETNEFTYTPDFYLPDYDKFIEVKGYFRTPRAKEKFEVASTIADILLVRKAQMNDLSCIKRFIS